MPDSSTLVQAGVEDEIAKPGLMTNRQPPVPTRTTSVSIQSWQSAAPDSSYGDNRHARSASMDSLESSGSSSSGGTNNSKADATAVEFLPTRNISKPTKLPSHNPLQFVKVQSSLCRKAEQQIKQTKDVKVIRETLKEGEEEWQSNLDNWKSRRRKVSEKVILRAEEMRQIEAEEKLRHEQSLQQTRKFKTFSEIVERRSSRSYNLELYIGQGDDSGLGGTPEPDETIDGQNSIMRSDTSEGMTSEAESIDSDIHKSEKIHEKEPPKVPHKPQMRLKRDTVIDEFENSISSSNAYFSSMSPKDFDNFSSTEPSDIEGHCGDSETISSEEDLSYLTDCQKAELNVESQEKCDLLENDTLKLDIKSTQYISDPIKLPNDTDKNSNCQSHTFNISIKPGDNRGFGFTMKGGKDQRYSAYIDSVAKYSPADITGLKQGDKILSLNGEFAADCSHASLIFSIKQAAYAGALDIVISRSLTKVPLSPEIKIPSKKSSFAEKLALFSSGMTKTITNSDNNKHVPPLKAEEVKGQSLVLRRRSAFENEKKENNIVYRRSSCLSHENSNKAVEAFEKRLSADLTMSHYNSFENEMAKKRPSPPPVPVKPKLKPKTLQDFPDTSQDTLNVNGLNALKCENTYDLRNGILENCNDTNSPCKYSTRNGTIKNYNEDLSVSNKTDQEVDVTYLNEKVVDDVNYIYDSKAVEDSATQKLVLNNSCNDSNINAELETVALNSELNDNISPTLDEEFALNSSSICTSQSDKASVLYNREEVECQSKPHLSENAFLSYSSLEIENVVKSDNSITFSNETTAESKCDIDADDKFTLVSEKSVFSVPLETDICQKLNESEEYDLVADDEDEVLCDFSNDAKNFNLEDDAVAKFIEFEDNCTAENTNLIALDNSEENATNNQINPSPLCLPLEKIDEDDVISASTTTSSETPDTETVIETLPSNLSPLPNDESNGEESSKCLNSDESGIKPLAEISVPVTDSSESNCIENIENLSALENVPIHQDCNDYKADFNDSETFVFSEKENDEYCRELDESIDQITSLDVIDEIEQRLMQQLEHDGVYEVLDDSSGQFVPDDTNQWLYLSEAELLDQLTPRNLEPPKEPPPPPPPQDVEEPDEQIAPMARTNSTKRIKKELWRRRSDFLGLHSPEGIDLDSILPPPPGLEEILKQEREQTQWLEKRLSLAETDISAPLYTTDPVNTEVQDYLQSNCSTDYFLEDSDPAPEISEDISNEQWTNDLSSQIGFECDNSEFPFVSTAPASVPEEKVNESPQHKAKQSLHTLGAAPKAKIIDSNTWITEKSAPVSKKPIEPVFRHSTYNQNYWLAQDDERKRSTYDSESICDRRFSIPPSNAHPDVTVRTWGDRECEYQKRRPQSAAWNSSTERNSYDPYSDIQDVLNTRLDIHGDSYGTDILEAHKCSFCGEGLCEVSAMGIEALSLYFHIECFRCSVCRMQLGNGTCGTDVQVKNSRLYCPKCFAAD